jgi:hypothetical protein
MGTILNQLYKEKISEYGELDQKAKEIAASAQAKMYRATQMRRLEKEKKQLDNKISAIKKKYPQDHWDIKCRLQKEITAKRLELEAKLLSVTPKEATNLILEFQKWWPKI